MGKTKQFIRDRFEEHYREARVCANNEALGRVPRIAPAATAQSRVVVVVVVVAAAAAAVVVRYYQSANCIFSFDPRGWWRSNGGCGKLGFQPSLTRTVKFII